MRIDHVNGVKAVAALAVLASLTGCASFAIFGGNPEPAAGPPPPAAAPESAAPPPVDLAGRWQLAVAAGGSCFMNFGDATHAAAASVPEGQIAPEGGCPGNFFTSRKWTFADGRLIIRDFKGRPLAHLSYLAGHFEGQDKNGGALTLSKQN
jgi:hypothetical protein